MLSEARQGIEALVPRRSLMWTIIVGPVGAGRGRGFFCFLGRVVVLGLEEGAAVAEWSLLEVAKGSRLGSGSCAEGIAVTAAESLLNCKGLELPSFSCGGALTPARSLSFPLRSSSRPRLLTRRGERFYTLAPTARSRAYPAMCRHCEASHPSI